MELWRQTLSPLEAEVLELAVAGSTNEEIANSLKQKLKISPTTVRNAMLRIYDKAGIGDADDEEDLASYRKRQRIAKRTRLVRKFLEHMREEQLAPMRWCSDEQDFYVKLIDVLEAREAEVVGFASKTPVLLLARELYTEARAQYHKSLIGAIERSRIAARYVFCLPTTLRELKRLGRETDSREVANHLKLVAKTLRKNAVDLRCVPTPNFFSGLVGEKEGAILYKDPIEDATLFVEFVRGPRLALMRAYHEKVFERARRVTPEAVSRLHRVGAAHL